MDVTVVQPQTSHAVNTLTCSRVIHFIAVSWDLENPQTVMRYERILLQLRTLTEEAQSSAPLWPVARIRWLLVTTPHFSSQARRWWLGLAPGGDFLSRTA
jgi:hypothetical protein